MSVFDHLLNTVRLNDDYDDDFYDDDENFDDEEEVVTKKAKEPKTKEPKVNSRFSKKMDSDDFDDFDDEPVKPKKKKSGKEKASRYESGSYSARNSKITPIKKKVGDEIMEVCVIKPTSMEETKEIVDTLREGCTVVLNLEGLDVETAQRIIDFVSGASYAVDGALRMVSSFIFILTPAGVEITGDIQDILGDTAPNIRTEF